MIRKIGLLCVIMVTMLMLMIGCTPKKNISENQTTEYETNEPIQTESVYTIETQQMDVSTETVESEKETASIGSNGVFGSGEEEVGAVYPTETTPIKQPERPAAGNDGLFGNGEEENGPVEPTEIPETEPPAESTENATEATDAPENDLGGIFGGAGEEE